MMMQEHVDTGSTGVTAATFGFELTLGGRYLFTAAGTFTTAAVQVSDFAGNFLDIFGAYDAAAAEQNEKINTLSAAGALVLDLPPGTYQFAFAGNTGAGAKASVTRAPLC